jgi:hypothetical protein
LGVDIETIDATFPAANSTDHDIEVRHDPNGTNELIETVTVASTNYQLKRITILQALGGLLPTGGIQISVTASHTEGVDVLTSIQALTHSYAVTSALTGQFEFGLLSKSEVSPAYPVTVTGSYFFLMPGASGLTAGTGDIEYRNNGGAWTTLIPHGAAGSGAMAFTAGDSIEIRNQATDTGYLRHIDMTAFSGGQDGFFLIEP